jgi:F-type H+-transporting ATPase subunit b
MNLSFFAAETTQKSGLPLGLSLKTFAIQLITFIFIFFILKKFAFNRIVTMLEKRRQAIEDGVKLGEKMEKREARLEEEAAAVLREAREEADHIVANANKESRDILREAEKAAKVKTDALISDAKARIVEESDQARRNLEKDLVGLVGEATETIVQEKVDPKKDAELIDRAMRGRKK